MGLAERALMELARETPQSEFHIITSKFRRGLPCKEVIENMTIFRVGFGSVFDKFLLPFSGVMRAIRLHKKNEYRFMWSIMASYSGIAGRIMKAVYPKMSFIVTDYETKDSPVRNKLVKLIKQSADKVYSSEDRQDEDDFTKAVRDDYARLLAKQEGKLERPV